MLSLLGKSIWSCTSGTCTRPLWNHSVHMSAAALCVNRERLGVCKHPTPLICDSLPHKHTDTTYTHSHRQASVLETTRTYPWLFKQPEPDATLMTKTQNKHKLHTDSHTHTPVWLAFQVRLSLSLQLSWDLWFPLLQNCRESVLVQLVPLCWFHVT